VKVDLALPYRGKCIRRRSGNQAVQRTVKAAPATPKPSVQPPNVVQGIDSDVGFCQVAEELYAQWQGPQDAYTWAGEQNGCRFTQNSDPVIFAAFYARQLEKLQAKQPVAA
jgi:hypothetical protein